MKVKYLSDNSINNKKNKGVLEKRDICCIDCGKKDVWEDITTDDYYLGCRNICLACYSSFYYTPSGKIDQLEEDNE